MLFSYLSGLVTRFYLRVESDENLYLCNLLKEVYPSFVPLQVGSDKNIY